MKRNINTQQLVVFQNNSSQRDTLKDFMIEVLEEVAIEKAFKGEDVKGIPEARNLVDRMFDKLDELYGKIDPPVESNSR